MRLLFILLLVNVSLLLGQTNTKSKFYVVGFYTGINDLAHVSFVQEANAWLQAAAIKNNFVYESTNNWDNLNDAYLSKYQIVIFLDTRPEKPEQRDAFRKYIERGGGFIGFHFSAFAMNNTAYPQNWDWYHNTFLGCGQYVSNTWKPTSAVLKVERAHPVTKALGNEFVSAPNEWYRWENDLTKNKDISILLSIDPKSFPLGTGPKKHEIWLEGYYPVVWTNKRYHMVYINMGHNDMDYDDGTNKTLSATFGNYAQEQLVLNALLWLGSMH